MVFPLQTMVNVGKSIILISVNQKVLCRTGTLAADEVIWKTSIWAL